ncbi:MAG TPA: hypothetical protein VII01_15265, partial [Solirubrobacteraceae bacterium]
MPTAAKTPHRPPITFRTAGEAERAHIDRAAAAEGLTTSEFVRRSVRDRLSERAPEAALLNALRATGATMWIDVKRARGDKPPTARVARLHGGDVSSVAELEVQALAAGRYALCLVGVGELAGARIVLAALPARLAATLEVPLAGLGDNLLEA